MPVNGSRAAEAKTVLVYDSGLSQLGETTERHEL